MKKKLCFVLIILFAIASLALFLPKGQDYDYLRLHIRANSNLEVDQNVKYKIKADMVQYLTPHLVSVKSKQQAIDVVNGLKLVLIARCNKILADNGFSYTANVKVNNEYFPTRTYSNTTLDAGYYDAVIVELGKAEGDNWWCVMYPPLCFVGKGEASCEIKYKSKIVEWFKSIF